MAYLINRNPSGRIVCLHALLKYLNNKFGEDSFTLTDMKYDEKSTFNIHQTCTLLVKLPSVSFTTCPYLDNPLSEAKCYLTQSKQKDTQKSKSVSDAFNALEGLGFVKKIDTGGKITENGKKFIAVDYHDEKCYDIIKEGLLGYGPFIGLLNELVNSKGQINRSEVTLGYPVTNETVEKNGKLIRLSTGSQQDTITRTRSVLFIWALTGGFIKPVDFPTPQNVRKSHVEMLPYIKSKNWGVNKFDVLIEKKFFKKTRTVNNPLNYLSMTKTTRALRERNQETVRTLSLKYEEIIKNRRYAIVYLLAHCSERNKKLNFEKTIQELSNYPDLFVINPREFDKIMYIELGIASVSGIPYNVDKQMLNPLIKVNINKLCENAPKSLIETLNEIYEKVIEK